MWYWVGGGDLHPQKRTTFHRFMGTFVFLLQTKYRKKPDSIKFTSVVDSPDLVHAKNSYLQCSEVSVFSLLFPGRGLSGQRLTPDPWAPNRIDVSTNLLSTTWVLLNW